MERNAKGGIALRFKCRPYFSRKTKIIDAVSIEKAESYALEYFEPRLDVRCKPVAKRKN